MRISALILIFLTGAICSACSRVDAIPQKDETFTYTLSITPTPLTHASSRYSDFVYHYRKRGDGSFVDVPSSSVEPTKDGSVLAKFKIHMPQPEVDQAYERYVSYRLDGNLVKEGQPAVTLVGSSAR